MSIEEIQYQCLERNIPFYCYRLPGSKDVVVGIQRDPEITPFAGFATYNHQPGFLIVPFVISGSSSSLFIREDFRITQKSVNEEAEKWIDSVFFEVEKADLQGYEQTQEEYLKEVSGLIQLLKKKKLSKVVYSRIIALKKFSADRFKLFRLLVHSYPNAFVYCFHIPGKAVWMGATPELFLQVRQGVLKTVALAGTKKISDQSWSDKEHKEQEYVNRFIREVLDKCRLNNRTESEPKSVHAGECAHLKTDFRIRAGLSGPEVDRLIRLLHPTPAVCGYPQAEAMNEILRRERHDRQFYSGFLGPVSAVDRMDLFVNLRCMKIAEEQIELFVGGGITKDSNPQEEWDETMLKAQTLMKVIEI